MWIVRSASGYLFAFLNKPYCTTINGERTGWASSVAIGTEIVVYRLHPYLFPEITIDNEPRWIRFIKQEWIVYKAYNY